MGVVMVSRVARTVSERAPRASGVQEGRAHVAFPSIHRDMPHEAYLATPCVSKSALWTAVTRSPAHARMEKAPTPAMALGTAIHCAVLEPDTFAQRFRRGPADRRTKEWRELAGECGDGLMTAGDYDTALAVRDAVWSDPLVKRLLAGAQTEVSAFWEDGATGLKCRARPDVYNARRGVLADLKSTADARPDAFARTVANLGYHAQEAFYRDGWAAAGGTHEAFVFLAVETAPPYAHALYELDEEAVAIGRTKMQTALELWSHCLRCGAWPAYEPGVRALKLPRYASQATIESAEGA